MKKFVLLVVIILLFSLGLTSCKKKSNDSSNVGGNQGNSGENGSNSGGESNTETKIPKNISFTDFAKNLQNEAPKKNLLKETGAFKAFQYHVGTLNSVPISYGNGIGFDGIPVSVSFSSQSITEESITKTYEKCTETMVDISANLSLSSMLTPWGTGVKYDIGIETTFSESIKRTEEKSISFTKSKGESITYPIDDRYCKTGYKYRLVLTSAFDVYYIVIYDKILDKIYEYYNMEIIEGEQTFYIEECPKENLWRDNNFNPVDYPKVNAIADGIKNSSVSSDLIIKRSRNEEKTISDSGRFNQHHDDYNFKDLFNYSCNDLKKAGYKTLKMDLQIDIKEVNNGYQYIMIFAHSANSGEGVDGCTIEHGGTNKNTTYKTYNYTFNIDLDKFNDEVIIIRYGASGNSYDNWKNKNLKITFTIFK